MTVEAGYVGSKSDRLLNDGLNNINIVPFGAMINDPNGDQNSYRPLSQYGDVPVSRHTHYQNYNALQTLLSRQGSRFSYTAAYTWSKALGIRGGGQGSDDAAAGRHPRFGLRRARLRPPSRVERRLQLVASGRRGQRRC